MEKTSGPPGDSRTMSERGRGLSRDIAKEINAEFTGHRNTKYTCERKLKILEKQDNMLLKWMGYQRISQKLN